MPTPTIDIEKLSVLQSFRALAKSILGFERRRLPRLTVLMVLASLLEGLGLVLIFPLASLIFEDLPTAHPLLSSTTKALSDIGLETTPERLWFFSAVYILIILARAWILLLRDAELVDHKNGFINNERKLLYRVLAHAPWPIISKLDRADILNTLTYDLSRAGTCVHFFFNGVMQCVQIAIFLIVSALISPALTLAFIALGAVVGVTAGFWLKQSQKLGREETIASHAVMFETNVFLAGLKTAQVYGAEIAFLDRFDTAINNAAKIDLTFVLQQGRLRRGLEILMAIALLSLFLIGYLGLHVSAPALLAIAAILMRLAPQLLSFMNGMQFVANSAPAFIRAQHIRSDIALQSDEYVNKAALEATKSTKKLTGVDQTIEPASITFNDISVSVSDPSGPKTLLTINALTLPPKGLVLIDGPSGAGKSTFAETLCGLREPSSGTIKIGDRFINASNRGKWQSMLALLPQEPFLFHGSVRDNLGWPQAPVEDNLAWTSLKTANAFDLVKDLPLGLDEHLREGGSRLSSGERQRLCLARTFLREAWIYVLDEPTSNLDGGSEQIIMQNLLAYAKTKLVILISHNPSLQTQADMVISFNDGRITRIKDSNATRSSS